MDCRSPQVASGAEFRFTVRNWTDNYVYLTSKPTTKSWRLDETYIKVKGRDRFLYRAVDSTGQTIEFLLTDARDAAAGKRFIRRALQKEGSSMPRVINVDKNPACPRAVGELKAEGTICPRAPVVSM